jgi:hypothetical protein
VTSSFSTQILELAIIFGFPIALLYLAGRSYWLMYRGDNGSFHRVLALNATVVICVLVVAFSVLISWPSLQSPNAFGVVLWLWVAACVLPAILVARRAPVGWFRRLWSMGLCAICTHYLVFIVLLKACPDPMCKYP